MSKQAILKKFVRICRESNAEYHKELCNATDKLTSDTDPQTLLEMFNNYQIKYKYPKAVNMAVDMVKSGNFTIAEIKDAAWKGYNGLMEATCIEHSVQVNLNLPVSKINPNDFMMIA